MNEDRDRGGSGNGNDNDKGKEKRVRRPRREKGDIYGRNDWRLASRNIVLGEQDDDEGGDGENF